MRGLAASGTDGTRPDEALLWRGATPVMRAALLAEAAAIAHFLAEALPGGACVVNLCEQREHFLLASAAALLAGRVQLLPVARNCPSLSPPYLRCWIFSHHMRLARYHATVFCNPSCNVVRGLQPSCRAASSCVRPSR